MFKTIIFEKLIKGDKYLIKHGKDEYVIGRFIKYNNESSYFHVKHIYFKQLYYYIHKKSIFYEYNYQKDNIQNAMELRAVNKILRKITGDPLFIYK